jgi:prepilin-type N-terminal cleavage/methylation domain-containing protein
MKSGYTLIELLVVMGIIFLMASLSLVNHNQFGREIDLENNAYKMALDMRTAQAFGINRRDDSDADGTLTLETWREEFKSPDPYGIVFTSSNSSGIAGMAPESYMIFLDRSDGSNQEFFFDGNDTAGTICTSNSSSECIDVITMNNGIYVSEICVGDSASSCNNVNTVHISFKRPNPDAHIKVVNTGVEYSYAEITVMPRIAGISEQKISVGVAGQVANQ